MNRFACMNAEQTSARMAEEMSEELTGGILPFWMEKMTAPERGFYGRISGEGLRDENAPRGAVMNARILWTFSSAYRIFRKPEYLETAENAFREISERFYDRNYGGIYWSLDSKGAPLDKKKQIYAAGFAIYGLSEFYRAAGKKEALDLAVRLYEDIERHSFDRLKNGYVEALAEDWSEIGDMRLSDKDENERKTMNTHLHILEPYTNLYRIWNDPGLKERLVNLTGLFIDRILDKDTGHLGLFFDDDWNSKYPLVSFGHDIEASWLLHEAALVSGDGELLGKTVPAVRKIACAAEEGLLSDGGMIYEMNVESGAVDADRHWWVQAETVVGYYNLWQHFGDTDALTKAASCWDFIKKHMIDRSGGEWFWSLKPDGSANRTDDKAGFWKCPYHNGRMCMEIIERSGLRI